ncbi:tetratricopeptide repeat protein [Capnocytophaga granulosa]|uniref:tetratricopeptide repeat protein n=1 Tax=Capnocytophaga granulosa TaxID=45242 RepID=UPI0038579A42
MKEVLEFNRKWQAMPLEEKMRIAMQTDSYNNQGALSLHSGNIEQAISYFEKALEIMPINDDALHNLIICYKRKEEYGKIPPLWAKLYIVEPTIKIKEKIIGYTLMTLLIENYEDEYDMGIVGLSELLEYLKNHYNIDTSDEEISKVYDKINHPWSSDILTYGLAPETYLSSSYEKKYRAEGNVSRSIAKQARQDIFNW